MLGCAFSSFYEKTFAAPSAAVELGTEDQSKEVLAELKEINTHVKSIDTLLKSGRLKVVPVVGGQPAQTDQLQMVTVSGDQETAAVALCTLGVRRSTRRLWRRHAS